MLFVLIFFKRIPLLNVLTESTKKKKNNIFGDFVYAH